MKKPKRPRRRSPRRPLEWGSDYLKNLCIRMFENMDEAVFEMLATFMAAQCVVWGSGCSGTECPDFAIAALVSAMLEMNVPATSRHSFSAESEQKKRQFIHLVTSKSRGYATEHSRS